MNESNLIKINHHQAIPGLPGKKPECEQSQTNNCDRLLQINQLIEIASIEVKTEINLNVKSNKMNKFYNQMKQKRVCSSGFSDAILSVIKIDKIK